MSDNDPRIAQVISDQIEKVTDIHGLYHSPHEGFAIIREEFIEGSDAFDDLGNALMDLDKAVRFDMDRNTHLNSASKARNIAMDALKEVVDICVTLDRYIISLAQEKDGFSIIPTGDNDNYETLLSSLIMQYMSEGNTSAYSKLHDVREGK